MKVGLRAVKVFSQFGFEASPDRVVEGHPKGIIPDDVWMKWSEHSPAVLNNRLNNGWVEWVPVPEAGDTVDTGPGIDSMDKAALMQYAEEVLKTKVDGRQNVEALRQQVRAIHERAAILQQHLASRKAAESHQVTPKAPAGAAAPNAPPAGNEGAGGTGDGGGGT